MSTLRGHYPLKSTGAGFSIKNIEIDPPIVKLSGTNGTKILNDEYPMSIRTRLVNGSNHRVACFYTNENYFYALDLDNQPMELEIWTNDNYPGGLIDK